MAEANSTSIWRRSTRLFIGEQDAMEAGIAGQMERDSRHVSEEKEQEKPQKAQKSHQKVATTNTIETPMIPLVDFGRDLCGIFPLTAEDMDDHGTRISCSSKRCS